MQVIDKREVDGKSVNMEKLGARRAITEILDSGVVISEMVTDSHPQVISLMSKYFPRALQISNVRFSNSTEFDVAYIPSNIKKITKCCRIWHDHGDWFTNHVSLDIRCNPSWTTDNKFTLVQTTTWYYQSTNHYRNQCYHGLDHHMAPLSHNKVLTHWGRVTHICVGKLSIIGSDNGLSPGQHHNSGTLLIESSEANFSEILIQIYISSFKKICVWKYRLESGVHFVSA